VNAYTVTLAMSGFLETAAAVEREGLRIWRMLHIEEDDLASGEVRDEAMTKSLPQQKRGDCRRMAQAKAGNHDLGRLWRRVPANACLDSR
jgi:hypothetical protein